MNPTILTELSALGRNKAINPMLPKLISEIKQLRTAGFGKAKLVVDSGCGQLRHLDTLLASFSQLCLVDTEMQLRRKHSFDGENQTVGDFVKTHYSQSRIRILNNKQFAASTLSAGVVISINVLDVTPPAARNEILTSAFRNLSKRGLFAAIVPRNDSRTLALCSTARKYQDGYIFPNHNAFTFYRNWTNNDLAKLFARHSLKVILDISNYRYACVVCAPL